MEDNYKPGLGTVAIHLIVLLIYGAALHQIYLDIITNFITDSWSIIIIQVFIIGLALLVVLILMIVCSMGLQFIIWAVSINTRCSPKNKERK